MKIFTAAQMRELDRLTVERCGIPYATLMETAGSRVVEAIIKEYGPVEGKTFAVLCGKGNNGGDGAVVARLLAARGASQIAVFLLGELEETKGEARTNFDILFKANEESCKHDGIFHPYLVSMVTGEDYAFPDFGSQIVVDALLGTGIVRPTSGLYEKAITTISSLREEGRAVVSVDIPSGLSSDNEHSFGPHVRADLTVSFTGPKIGNVLAPACEANGKLIIASIGTPTWLFEEVGSQLNLVEERQIKDWLEASRRTAQAHKTSVGDVLLIAGSRGKTGAAALSAETVLRAGAGLVTIATARSAQALLVTQSKNEVMTEGLEENEAGAIIDAALDHAFQLAAKRTVLALGPGLSSSDDATRHFVREFAARRNAPLVIDADGLNALAPWPDGLKGSVELPIIITPHPGEMARLTGKTNAEIVADRLNVAREFATKHHVITVLKGSRSLIAAPDGQVYVNPTGNAGMATAGSGDVLTGLLTGLLAQQPQVPLEATIAAVYLHGLAGDLAAAQLGQRSLIASDLIAHLSEAILQVGGAAERGQSNSITMI
jgi:ADP-dependent NAD(P)H-hydrate dehydratase / NAD(P)H-hydrate epimerase